MDLRNNREKTRSWIVPGTIAGMCGIPLLMGCSWPQWSLLILGLGLFIFGFAALVNVVLYVAGHVVEIRKEMIEAQYRLTPAYLADSMSKLSDQAVRVFSRFGAPIWALRPGHREGSPIVDGETFKIELSGTGITMEFVVDFLEGCGPVSVPAQGRYADRMYTFDPIYREVQDRVMHRRFIALLHSLGVVSLPVGNQPAKWSPGWGVSRVRQWLLIDRFYEEPPSA